MKSVFLLAFLSVPAMATTIVFDWGKVQTTDVAKKFEAECAHGDYSAPCQAMASMLRVELKTGLPMLKDTKHPDNVAVYQEVLTLSDPDIHEVAMKALSHNTDPEIKQELLASALIALFGEDSLLVNKAMKYLDNANLPEFEEVREVYENLQDTSVFTNSQKVVDAYFYEWWHDTTSFLDSFYFPVQERFLPFDSAFAAAYSPDGLGYSAGRAYHTSASFEEVVAYFSQKLGPAAMGMDETSQKMKGMEKEFQEISLEMQQGNYSRMQRMQELMMEINGYQQQGMKYAQVGIKDKILKTMTAFFVPDPNNEMKIDGAVLVRHWPVLGGTAIIYVKTFAEEQ